MGVWDSHDSNVRGEREVAQTGKRKYVCVTGSWSLVGSWLVRTLLEKGYNVRSTLRTSTDEAAALMALPGAEQRLELTQADPLDYGSLVECFFGCDGVFHTSSPSDVISNYPPEMADFEVRGALNVVEACANTSVKRLVLTSSLSAMVWDQQRSVEKVIDEKCWSNLDLCRSKKLWGPLAKTMTEKAAWSLATDKGLDLVVINPAIVLGPKQSGRDQAILTYLQGVQELPQSGLFAFAHVDDVAEAHVCAFEVPEASGRYICYEDVVSEEALVAYIYKLYPDSIIPSSFSKNGLPHLLTNQKLKTLSLKARQH